MMESRSVQKLICAPHPRFPFFWLEFLEVCARLILSVYVEFGKYKHNINIKTGGTMRVESERLVTDLKTVARDAEDLVKATAGDVGEKAREARSRLMTALESAKHSAQVVQEKAIAGAKATDQAIRNHPYPALGIAFGVGVLIGVLAARSRRD
jgi:ElaB/YqjD/DUF883 family membrane-anchored ribosome-binding protein